MLKKVDRWRLTTHRGVSAHTALPAQADRVLPLHVAIVKQIMCLQAPASLLARGLSTKRLEMCHTCGQNEVAVANGHDPKTGRHFLRLRHGVHKKRKNVHSMVSTAHHFTTMQKRSMASLRHWLGFRMILCNLRGACTLTIYLHDDHR